MKRGASGDIFLKLIERIRRTIPGVAIRTSFIVGFPGETDRDFEELCSFVKAARARNRKLVGSETTVLVSGLSAETDLLWEGRMPTQAPEIDGVTLINDFEGSEPRPGQMRRLRITEAHDYDLVGTLLAGGEQETALRVEAAPSLVQIAAVL